MTVSRPRRSRHLRLFCAAAVLLFHGLALAVWPRVDHGHATVARPAPAMTFAVILPARAPRMEPSPNADAGRLAGPDRLPPAADRRRPVRLLPTPRPTAPAAPGLAAPPSPPARPLVIGPAGPSDLATALRGRLTVEDLSPSPEARQRHLLIGSRSENAVGNEPPPPLSADECVVIDPAALDEISGNLAPVKKAHVPDLACKARRTLNALKSQNRLVTPR